MRDIKLNPDYDLDFRNGDFVVDDTQEQHIELLLLSKQGEWKDSPLTGCDIQKAQHGGITRMLDRHIRIQLEADGFQLEELQLSNQGISVKGKYDEK
ncbi:hypothetical protein GO491_03170 [Flavobacteriaceae bacterium Ap0902]|nr:hypothetical protein [Flavobacteriaceae bacterium Ap0902]